MSSWPPSDRTRHTTAGTPNYMAPELLDGRPFNKSVDVYAFGIVLYEVGMSVRLCHIAHEPTAAGAYNAEPL